MKLGMPVGLGPGHIVLDWDQRAQLPQFSAHICCGQMVGWIKMPLGMDVGLVPGDFVLDEDPPLPPQKGSAPNFRPITILAKRLDGSRCDLVRM